MVESSTKTMGQSYEELYAGHMIFTEPNRDRYRGGVEWSVCRDDIELECGLEFSDEEALNAARKFVDAIRP